jgi:uncharacterized protein (DUF1697 family)
LATYVALLRGIGPGNPNMRNEKLRSVFVQLGFKNVQSVISSGNIIFESSKGDIPKLESQIEHALTAELGINSAVIIRNHDQLKQLAANNYFGERLHNPKTYLTVTFLKQSLSNNFTPAEDSGIIKIDPQLGVVCAVIDTISSKTPNFMVWLEKQFGKGITTRTWNTVQRILKKMPAS